MVLARRLPLPKLNQGDDLSSSILWLIDIWPVVFPFQHNQPGGSNKDPVIQFSWGSLFRMFEGSC